MSRERDFLKEKFDKYGNPADWIKYKKVRNRVNNLNKKLKKNYYIKELDGYNNNMKMTWKTLKNLSSVNTCSEIKLQRDDTILCDPFEVACTFNEHFTRDVESGDVENEREINFPVFNEVFTFNEISEEFVKKRTSIVIPEQISGA